MTTVIKQRTYKVVTMLLLAIKRGTERQIIGYIVKDYDEILHNVIYDFGIT